MKNILQCFMYRYAKPYSRRNLLLPEHYVNKRVEEDENNWSYSFYPNNNQKSILNLFKYTFPLNENEDEKILLDILFCMLASIEFNPQDSIKSRMIFVSFYSFIVSIQQRKSSSLINHLFKIWLTYYSYDEEVAQTYSIRVVENKVYFLHENEVVIDIIDYLGKLEHNDSITFIKDNFFDIDSKTKVSDNYFDFNGNTNVEEVVYELLASIHSYKYLPLDAHSLKTRLNASAYLPYYLKKIAFSSTQTMISDRLALANSNTIHETNRKDKFANECFIDSLFLKEFFDADFFYKIVINVLELNDNLKKHDILNTLIFHPWIERRYIISLSNSLNIQNNNNKKAIWKKYLAFISNRLKNE